MVRCVVPASTVGGLSIVLTTRGAADNGLSAVRARGRTVRPLSFLPTRVINYHKLGFILSLFKLFKTPFTNFYKTRNLS